MKKAIYTNIICLLLFSIATNAQQKRSNKEKIRTLKIGYITEQLDLTEDEAQKFWPIYNLFDKKLIQLKVNERNHLKIQEKEIRNLDELPEKEAKRIVEKILILDKSFYETKQEMYLKLAKIIGYKKIIKLEITEKEFHRKLIRKLRRKGNR